MQMASYKKGNGLLGYANSLALLTHKQQLATYAKGLE